MMRRLVLFICITTILVACAYLSNGFTYIKDELDLQLTRILWFVFMGIEVLFLVNIFTAKAKSYAANADITEFTEE